LQTDSRGFSLIEVLVALVILAIVMLSVATLCVHSIRFTTHLRDHLDANWIAQNALAELQLGLKPQPSDSGTQTGAEKLDHHQWNWSASSSPGPFKDTLRLDIRVNKDRTDDTPYRFQGFISKATP